MVLLRYHSLRYTQRDKKYVQQSMLGLLTCNMNEKSIFTRTHEKLIELFYYKNLTLLQILHFMINLSPHPTKNRGKIS